MRVRPGLRVLQVIYQDPVTYPPTLNAMRLFAGAGAEVSCLGYRRGAMETVVLPRAAHIRYLNESQAIGTPAIAKKIANVASLRREPRREVARLRPDLVIAYDHGAAWGVLPLLEHASPKTILHLHDLLATHVTRFASSDGWMWAEMARRISRFDLVVVPEVMRAVYLRESWRITAPIRIVANSPPRMPRVKNQLLKRQIRERTGRTPELLAVAVGNMGYYIEMVRAVAATRSRWHLAVVGCGHPPSVSALLHEAKNLGVDDRVHVFPYTNYDILRRWLPGCDVGLAFYPSSSGNVNWQTMGAASVKIQEYMAAGVPSIVCPRSVFSALAEETSAIELLDTETADALTAALDNLEPGSARHSSLSSAATRSHLSKYNLEAQLQPVLDELGLG